MKSVFMAPLLSLALTFNATATGEEGVGMEWYYHDWVAVWRSEDCIATGSNPMFHTDVRLINWLPGIWAWRSNNCNRLTKAHNLIQSSQSNFLGSILMLYSHCLDVECHSLAVSTLSPYLESPVFKSRSEIRCPDWGFLWVSSVPSGKFQNSIFT
jgi:hypothetical protein